MNFIHADKPGRRADDCRHNGEDPARDPLTGHAWMLLAASLQKQNRQPSLPHGEFIRLRTARPDGPAPPPAVLPHDRDRMMLLAHLPADRPPLIVNEAVSCSPPRAGDRRNHREFQVLQSLRKQPERLPFTLVKPLNDYRWYERYIEIPEPVSVRLPKRDSGSAILKSVTARMRPRTAPRLREPTRETSAKLDRCLPDSETLLTVRNRQPPVTELARTLAIIDKRAERHSGYRRENHSLNVSRAVSMLADAACPVPPEQFSHTVDEIRRYANSKLPRGFRAEIRLVSDHGANRD